MSQPIYKRILLKLSGEALQGDEGFGIDPSILDRMALEIKELIEMGVEVGVVLGGGNLFRGAKLAKAGMNRVVGVVVVLEWAVVTTNANKPLTNC